MKTVTKETITEYDENGRVTRVTTTETTEEAKDNEPVCWYWCQYHNCWRCTCKQSWQVDTTPITNTHYVDIKLADSGTTTINGTNVGNDGTTATIKF